MELKGEEGKLPGVIIQPQIPEQFPLKFHIAPTIDLRLLAGTNAASQFGILLRPGEASIRYPFRTGNGASGRRNRHWLRFQSGDADMCCSARPAATRLEFQGAAIDFGAKIERRRLWILY